MAQENEEKMKALDLAISQIDRQFGKGSVMRLGDSKETGSIPAISTGSISLDVPLVWGCLPWGGLFDIFGP